MISVAVLTHRRIWSLLSSGAIIRVHCFSGLTWHEEERCFSGNKLSKNPLILLVGLAG